MLKVYTIAQSAEWDTIIRSFKDYDTYWLSGYVNAFKIHGDGEPLLFYYESDEIKGANVVMKRDIAQDSHFCGLIKEGLYFDFSTPYGYGGWLIEGKNKKKLFDTYEEWCVENGIVSEFVRFHPVIRNNVLCEGFYDIDRMGNTVTLDLSSPEVIWGNITSKNRNMIRKAQKNNIKVFFGRYPEIFDVFMDIYNQTMDRDNANKYYYFDRKFYESILMDLPYNAVVFYAVYSGRPIAASIMLNTNGKMNYHLSGSIKDFGHLAATNLIIYEASLWGCANGYKTLYLGGGVGSSEDGLYRFKKSFFRGDANNSFHIGRKVFSQEKYDSLVVMRKNLSTHYFPRYRTEG